MQRTTYKQIKSPNNNDDNGQEDINNSNSSKSNVNHYTTSHIHTKSTVERLSDKFYAFIWVTLALTVAYYTDIPRTLFTSSPSSSQVIRPIFNISITLLIINIILMIYLGVYLPKFKGLKDSSAWDAYCPRVIPIMSLNGVVCIVLLLRSCWPVWGFLTPFILGIEFFGCLFATHFIPWF